MLAMAAPKRETPLSEQERKRRNRIYQQRRREKTSNDYARAYRRAERRITTLFRERFDEEWQAILAEEVARASEEVVCFHPVDALQRVGYTIKCNACRQMVGSEPLH